MHPLHRYMDIDVDMDNTYSHSHIDMPQCTDVAQVHNYTDEIYVYEKERCCAFALLDISACVVQHTRVW